MVVIAVIEKTGGVFGIIKRKNLYIFSNQLPVVNIDDAFYGLRKRYSSGTDVRTMNHKKMRISPDYCPRLHICLVPSLVKQSSPQMHICDR